MHSFPQPESVEWSFSFIPIGSMDDTEALNLALRKLVHLVSNQSNYVFESSQPSTGVSNDTLRFIELRNKNNGLYACNVTTEMGSDFTLLLVNVKGLFIKF